MASCGAHSLPALPQEADRRRLLHMVSLIMPKSHRDTMEILFVFLKWVASFAHMDEETGSKMDLGNLATVICPSILYARGRDAVRDESFGAIRVITALLENQDEFFAVPQEFVSILHDQEYFTNSLDLPGKEFLKKCETYMKLKAASASANGRPPAMPYNSSNNGSNPRFAPPTSPILDRPPMIGPTTSERTARSHPGMPPSNLTYSPGSSAIPPTQSLMQNAQNFARPPVEDWTPPQRPANPNSSPSSRPSSYVQPRHSTDHANNFTPNSNAYPSAVRQRT